jgi:hypothetical protein
MRDDEKFLRYVERAVATGRGVESGRTDLLFSSLVLAVGFYSLWSPTGA